MKTGISIRGSVLLLLSFVLPLGSSWADEKITDADTIRSQVVEPELTRSIRGPATEKRSGYALEASRSVGDSSRSLTATEVKVESEARIELPNIRFKLGSHTELADAASVAQLKQLALALKDLPSGVKFLIEGHTCSSGSDEINNPLSARRADFVCQELIKSGVPASALKAIGCGAAEAHKDGVSQSASETRLAPYRKVMLHRIAQ